MRARTRACPSVLVALHSFTPVYMDEGRRWHVGVLYGRDARLGRLVREGLRSDGALDRRGQPAVFSERCQRLHDHRARRAARHSARGARDPAGPARKRIRTCRVGPSALEAFWRRRCRTCFQRDRFGSSPGIRYENSEHRERAVTHADSSRLRAGLSVPTTDTDGRHVEYSLQPRLGPHQARPPVAQLRPFRSRPIGTLSATGAAASWHPRDSSG